MVLTEDEFGSMCIFSHKHCFQGKSIFAGIGNWYDLFAHNFVCMHLVIEKSVYRESTLLAVTPLQYSEFVC